MLPIVDSIRYVVSQLVSSPATACPRVLGPTGQPSDRRIRLKQACAPRAVGRCAAARAAPTPSSRSGHSRTANASPWVRSPWRSCTPRGTHPSPCAGVRASRRRERLRRPHRRCPVHRRRRATRPARLHRRDRRRTRAPAVRLDPAHADRPALPNRSRQCDKTRSSPQIAYLTSLKRSIHEHELARRQGADPVCHARDSRSGGLGEVDMAQTLVGCGEPPMSRAVALLTAPDLLRR